MPAKPLAKDERNNFFFVDSRRLIIDEDYIEREDFGDIGAIVKWIEANGLRKLNPLRCYKKGENWVIIRGHRRHRAIKEIEVKTGALQMVPIFVANKGESLEQRYFEQATENDSKAYTPWEKAKVLKKARSFGWSEEKMIEESGWSDVYVRRLLSLADAPQKLINLVREGTVSGTYAMDVIAEGPESVQELIAKGEANLLPPTNPELFDQPIPPKPAKITKSDLRPNSIKIFKKWAPQVDVKEMSPEKAKLFKWLQKLLEGELTEEDFKKFFR